MDELAGEPTIGRRELEGNEELIHNLELVPNGVNLVNNVLHADDVVLPKRVLDDGVVGDGLPLVVDVHEPTLVDELTNRLQVGVSVGNVRLHKTKHLDGGLVQTNKGAVVHLTKTEELEDLPGLGVDSINTTDANHESQLGLRLTVEVASFLGLAAEEDLVALKLVVLPRVLLSTLEVLTAVGCVARSQLQDAGSVSSFELLDGFAFLQSGLRNRNSLGVPGEEMIRKEFTRKSRGFGVSPKKIGNIEDSKDKQRQ